MDSDLRFQEARLQQLKTELAGKLA